MITDQILTGAKILLVDDNVAMLCLLENVLNRLRFKNILKLSDSTRILTEFQSFAPDLVITDVEMPGLNGIQLVELLRSHQSPNDCLPILVLTGSESPQQKRQALVAGATDIMLKPFDSAEIQMRIRNLLRARFQHFQIEAQTRNLEVTVEKRTEELQRALLELKSSQQQVIQQERFRAFGEMAGGVVHDFNNALMSVIGYSELLLQDDDLLNDSQTVRNYLGMMNTAGRDASHVVSRLRDFYRPREEADAFTAININEILEQVVPLTQPKWHGQALETGRTIRIILELEKVPLILGNGAELREIFVNLIFNAVDAMPDGGVITLKSSAEDDGVKISIEDTGEGMTEEVVNRCLEPFFSTKQGHGTGLGLSMVFGIIRRHSGVLNIHSVLGSGTRFSITLPPHLELANPTVAPPLKTTASWRVLIVDDEPAVRDVLTRYLLNDGHQPSSAANGEEALNRVREEIFDFIIVDLGMPGMSGIELAETLKMLGQKLWVILITGFSLSSDQPTTAVDYLLKKPLLPEDLRRAMIDCAQKNNPQVIADPTPASLAV